MQLTGIFTTLFQFILQSKLHGEGQLNATGTSANHGNRQRPVVILDTGKQCKPAVVEAGDRLHRNGVVGSAFHFIDPRRRANID